MEGSLPKDVKFAVVKADNLPELQAMADAHNLPTANDPLALIVWDFDPAKQSAPSKAAFKWFLTDRGALQLPVVPLGDKLPDLPPEPKVKKVEAPADTEHVAVRITVRQEFVASNWAAIKRNPVQALMSILPVGIEVRAYGWREVASVARKASFLNLFNATLRKLRPRLPSFPSPAGWADFKHVTAPKHTRGKWTCVAKVSETGEGPFAYQVGEQVITITKWTRAKPVASEVWHAHGSKWFTVDGNEEETEVMEVDSQFEAPPTALDSPSAATQNAQYGPRGTTICNLGGHGDCGYRAIAPACAARSGKSVGEIQANIENLTKSIKARCIAWLKQHREWEDNWAADPTTDAEMEDGEPPKTAAEYLSA
ncbi:unnamed protein product, partial [Symbiodinium microadriaticum]